MTDEECKEHGFMTDSEIKEMSDRWAKMESDGIVDTQKYFDRMHDKIFGLNNMLIAAYFALVAFRKDIPNWSLIVPVANLMVLLNIDYLMLQRARIQSQITQVNEKQRDKYGKVTTKANQYSLLSIYSTLVVLVVFVYFLLS